MSPTLSSSPEICTWIDVPLHEIRLQLEPFSQMLDKEADGQFFFADDSPPDDLGARWIGANETGWRCQSIPRLHLMLEGEHELTFVRRGQSETVRLQAGDIWFFPADAHDNERFVTSCRYVAVIFHTAFTRFIVVNFAAASSGKHQAGVRKTLVQHWHEERPPCVASALNALTESVMWRTTEADERMTPRAPMHQKADHAAGYYLARGLWALLLRWVRDTAIEPAPLGKAHASWLAIDRFLQENYHHPIDRQQVADAVGLHPNRVSVLCTEFAGKSYREIVEERRLKQAARLLELSDHKIETISALCGFGNAAYFSRAFRHALGVTPGMWRVTHRKKGVMKNS